MANETMLNNDSAKSNAPAGAGNQNLKAAEKQSQNTAAAPAAKAAEPKLKRNKYAGKANKKRKKKLPTWVKLVITLLIVAAIGAGVYMLINYLLKKESEGQEIITAYSYRGQLATYINGWGTAAPKNKVDVSSKTIGKVTEVGVAAGDVVSAGDMLFVVDPTDSKEKLDDANTKYKNELKSLENIQKSIKELSVYAPFTGRMLDVLALEGVESVASGAELCRLVDDTRMKFTLLFSYGYIDKIQEGMKATVSIPQSMSTLPGTVHSVNNVKLSGEEGGVYFEVCIAVDNPGALTEGMTATAVVHGDNDLYPYNDSKLEYFRSEKVFAKTGGDVESYTLSNGYECKEGELILSLSSESLDDSLEDAQERVNTAREEVNELREAISSSVHTSPIDGVVTAVVVNVDDEITSSSSTLVTISDLSEMIINVNIDESEIDKVSAGTPVDISFSQSEGEKLLQGEVLSVSFEATSSNSGDVAYFPAQIRVKSDGSLMPGMGVNYQINSVLKEDCIIAPASAVIYTDEGAVVFVRSETASMYDKVVELPAGEVPDGFCAVPVEIGISDENGVEIKSGIGEDVEVFTQQVSNPDYGMGIAIG